MCTSTSTSSCFVHGLVSKASISSGEVLRTTLIAPVLQYRSATKDVTSIAEKSHGTVAANSSVSAREPKRMHQKKIVGSTRHAKDICTTAVVAARPMMSALYLLSSNIEQLDPENKVHASTT